MWGGGGGGGGGGGAGLSLRLEEEETEQDWVAMEPVSWLALGPSMESSTGSSTSPWNSPNITVRQNTCTQFHHVLNLEERVNLSKSKSIEHEAEKNYVLISKYFL